MDGKLGLFGSWVGWLFELDWDIGLMEGWKDDWKDDLGDEIRFYSIR